MKFVNSLFNTTGFVPRWWEWDVSLRWTHLISDIVIGLAFFCISILLFYYIIVKKKQNAKTRKILLLFGAFVFACGIARLVGATTFWYPWFRFLALVKVITATISVWAAFEYVRALPRFLELKDPKEVQQLRSILDNAADSIIMIDNKGLITSFNKASERIFGYGEQEALGKNIELLIPEAYNTEHSDLVKNYLETNKLKITDSPHEIMGQRKNGEVFSLELSLSKIEVEGEITFTGIIRDVSERKKMITELKRSNEALEQFAYVASHDLQEPIRMVMQNTGRLEKHLGDNLDERSRKYISFATEGAGRMQRLIKDLLDFSVATRTTPQFKLVDLNQVLDLVKQDLSPQLLKTQATVNAGVLPKINCDTSQIERLFLNLMSNSLKYHHPNRKPEINIEVENNRDHWLIKFKDNGIGFSQEHTERVFLLFQRLHSQSEYPGAGIGLTMCKKIVEHHGGEIWVNTEQGSGSTFFIKLPK